VSQYGYPQKRSRPLDIGAADERIYVMEPQVGHIDKNIDLLGERFMNLNSLFVAFLQGSFRLWYIMQLSRRVQIVGNDY